MINNRWSQQCIKTLASMQTAIYMLIIVGVVSALGTFIPQGQAPTFYMEHYGHFWGSVISGLSLYNLYRAWWFQILIALLCLSIIVCAYQRLRRAQNKLVLASLIMHMAFVLIVIGAAWSIGYSHSAGVEIVEGQTISLSDYGFESGELSLQKFSIDYYADLQPRQYTSDLTLLSANGQEHHQPVFVNHPLKMGNLKIYQSSWGWNIRLTDLSDGKAEEIVIKDGDRQLLDQTRQLSIQAIFIPDFDEKGRGIKSLSPLPNNPHVCLILLREEQIADMVIIPPGEVGKVGSEQFRVDSFAYYSGLQVKQDSGVNIVFAGFILLLLGMLARYLPIFIAREAD